MNHNELRQNIEPIVDDTSTPSNEMLVVCGCGLVVAWLALVQRNERLGFSSMSSQCEYSYENNDNYSNRHE